MNSASPGVIALFQPNQHYPDHEAYLHALAEAMRPEYEAIVAAGFLLQLDSPDLGLEKAHDVQGSAGRRVPAPGRTARGGAQPLPLRNVPADRVRLHVLLGQLRGGRITTMRPWRWSCPSHSRPGPRRCCSSPRIPVTRTSGPSLPRRPLPDDKILVPGVLDSTTNFVEHPRLVAERICRFADIVGRERVIAGDGLRLLDLRGIRRRGSRTSPTPSWPAMAEGAEIASRRLWP